MNNEYIIAQDGQFIHKGKPILLRGWALGSWMNYEHFMMGLPGSNSMILEAFERVYGKQCATEWMERMLTCMINEEDIRFLKSVGINSIRIPFGYHHFFEDDAPDVFLESGFERLDRVVKLCEKYELFVILDLHSTPGAQNTDWHSDNITGQALFWKYRCFQDQVIRLWEELASRYADHTWIAGYDVLNEPNYDLTEEQINGFYDRVISAIRKYDPYHILFLEGTDFGRDFRKLKLQEDPQIAYTVHFYPFVLEANILDPELDDKERIRIFTDIFDRQLGEVKKFGRPVWCGESGYEFFEKKLEPFYSMLINHNISICEERGISWNLWTYKDARRMGILVPKEDSRWIQMRRDISSKWSHEAEQRYSMEITRYIGQKYYEPLDEHLAYILDFRVRSILHQIAVEQVLIPKLRSIPWSEMKDYPDDFLFANCEQREIIIEDIKKFIMQREEKQ